MSEITTLEKIEAMGNVLLDKIELTKPTAQRQYYQVAKILLEVEEIKAKTGKSKDKDIADALAKHLKKSSLPLTSAAKSNGTLSYSKSTVPNNEDITAILARLKHLKAVKYQNLDAAQIVELIVSALGVLIALIGAYEKNKEIKASRALEKQKEDFKQAQQERQFDHEQKGKANDKNKPKRSKRKTAKR